MEIAKAIKIVLEKIHSACTKAGRNAEDIKLIAVTKTIELPKIIEAVNAGIKILGENRVQEAQKKVMSDEFSVTSNKIEWHLIGNLQKNKAKFAVQLFNLIHAVDSIELAKEVNSRAERTGKIQRILVQVKFSEEKTKHGISEKALIPFVEKIAELKHLKLEGFMTMPPFFDDPEKARPYFKKLRDIRDNINAVRITQYALQDLSMGMSGDFEVAIEEGSTMVRIGTAIFGERK